MYLNRRVFLMNVFFFPYTDILCILEGGGGGGGGVGVDFDQTNVCFEQF